MNMNLAFISIKYIFLLMMQIYVCTYCRWMLWKNNKYGWKIRFKNVTSYAGQVISYNKEIIFSNFLLKNANWKTINHTIIHEFAHVLIGVENGHNHKWIKCFEKMGGYNEVLYTEEIVKDSDYKYIAECLRCKIKTKYMIRYTTYCNSCGDFLKYKIN